MKKSKKKRRKWFYNLLENERAVYIDKKVQEKQDRRDRWRLVPVHIARKKYLRYKFCFCNKCRKRTKMKQYPKDDYMIGECQICGRKNIIMYWSPDDNCWLAMATNKTYKELMA